MHKTEFMVKVSNDVNIQAILYSSAEEDNKSIVCIITHPYSRWGGSMQNNVVVGARNQLVKGGFPCITFNFRGVGNSTGSMGDGIQEKDDLIAVCNYTRDNFSYSQIFIVGYSYGGLVSLSAAKELGEIAGMCLISYPIGFISHIHPDFDVSFPMLFIHGENDDLIPMPRVKKLLPKFKNKNKLVAISTDHFYNGKECRVGVIIRDFVSELEI